MGWPRIFLPAILVWNLSLFTMHAADAIPEYCVGSIASPIFCYRQETEESVSVFSWRREPAGEGRFWVVSDSDTEHFRNLVDNEGRTYRWEIRSEGLSVEGVLHENGSLVLTGKRDGTRFHSRYDIGNGIWYQALSYSLSRQAALGNMAVTFWMIRPDTLKPVELIAKKEDPELLTIGGKQQSCFRYRLSGVGLVGSRWHAFYWYREVDGVFARYDGLFGFPGLPRTTIELIP